MGETQVAALDELFSFEIGIQKYFPLCASSVQKNSIKCNNYKAMKISHVLVNLIKVF